MPPPSRKRFRAIGSDAVYFYTRDVPAAEACDLQARMFHPGSSGLSEDPATGSATVAAAALLADLASERDGELKLRIGQGVDMRQAEPAVDARGEAEWRDRFGACRRPLRADDGGHVPAGGRGYELVMPGLSPCDPEHPSALMRIAPRGIRTALTALRTQRRIDSPGNDRTIVARAPRNDASTPASPPNSRPSPRRAPR